MEPTHREGGCWPTWQQRLLLRAALLQGQDAIAAWETFAGLDLDRLDRESYRLLPLLYKNLRAHGVDHPLMPRFKGAHRYTWYKNHLLLHRGAEILSALHEASIPTMVLKGTALVLLQYKDYGLRPMEDFDVMVPTSKRPEAIEVLTRHGWRPRNLALQKLTERYLDLWHAWGFEDDQQHQVDLHWHALYSSLACDADEDFWSGAVPVQLDDVATLAMNPADQLLQACVHGLWNTPGPQARWVADAKIILDTCAIDWNRLVTQAQKARLTLVTRQGLSYLSEEMNTPLPSSVLERLSNILVSTSEHLEHRIESRPWNRKGGFWSCCSNYTHFRRTNPDTRGVLGSLGFFRYLQLVWGEPALWKVPLLGASKALRRTWRITFKSGTHQDRSVKN